MDCMYVVKRTFIYWNLQECKTLNTNDTPTSHAQLVRIRVYTLESWACLTNTTLHDRYTLINGYCSQRLLNHSNFHIFCLWAYLMKVIPETCYVNVNEHERLSNFPIKTQMKVREYRFHCNSTFIYFIFTSLWFVDLWGFLCHITAITRNTVNCRSLR